MSRNLLIDALGWGFLLWVVGYVLGVVFFMILPPAAVGWAIMPIGILLTLWILFKKVNGNTFGYYFLLALVWTVIAVIFDYFLLVKVFKPADGYYKLDVYLYYTLTFLLPIFAAFRKKAKI